MKQVSAKIGSGAPSALFRRRSAMLLATASAMALLGQIPPAAALGCGGAPPDDIATPAALYEALRERTDAQLLAIGFAQQPADCAWVYEVKMLTASGSVVELDFDAKRLGLIGARGPDNDKEVARLVRGLGGNAGAVLNGKPKNIDSGPVAPGVGGGGSSDPAAASTGGPGTSSGPGTSGGPGNGGPSAGDPGAGDPGAGGPGSGGPGSGGPGSGGPGSGGPGSGGPGSGGPGASGPGTGGPGNGGPGNGGPGNGSNGDDGGEGEGNEGEGGNSGKGGSEGGEGNGGEGGEGGGGEGGEGGGGEGGEGAGGDD